MDSATIATLAASMGSMAGASASIVATWITQRTQTVRANSEWKVREREALYTEFITVASRLAVDAMLHSLERPDQLVGLYGIVSRIRLISSGKVLDEAEACTRRIVELYRRPNLTTEQFHDVVVSLKLDPLKEFTAACRKELLTPAGGD